MVITTERTAGSFIKIMAAILIMILIVVIVFTFLNQMGVVNIQLPGLN